MASRNALQPVVLATLILSATVAWAQIIPSEESLEGLYPGKAYSPYAHRNFPERPLWGDSRKTFPVWS